ncbi:MAG TPA: hypothetical protein VJQ84_06035 [Solirubrobacterales bacterium]|nr:hypothetical protein [Solirubrobacterales bacterium]
MLLGAGAAAYVGAAWSVAPGFYDGIGPAPVYRWVSPPPGQVSNANHPPLGGSANIPVDGSNGTAPLTAFTGDGQLVISFVGDSFQLSPGQQSVHIDIKAVGTFPTPNFKLGTNAYLVTANAPLKKQAFVQLTYSNNIPAPSYVYQAPEGGAWRNLGASQISAVYSLSTRTSSLGYFAGGYPSNVSPPPGAVHVGGGQTLPIIVAAIILLVLLGGIPLALFRRGRGDEEEEAHSG